MVCNRCSQEHGNDTVEVLCGALEPHEIQRVGDEELANLLAYAQRQEPHDATGWNIARYRAEIRRRSERLQRLFTARATITPDTIKAIRERFTGKQFVDLFARVTGYEVFPAGRETWKYRCVAHGTDNNPSGVLYLNELRFHCFGCNAGGDLFSLLTDSEGGFTAAVRAAAQMVGIEIVSKPARAWRAVDGLRAAVADE